MSEDIRVVVDGNPWRPNNNATKEYDAIHVVAGAVLAGADEVSIQRRKEGGDWP